MNMYGNKKYKFKQNKVVFNGDQPYLWISKRNEILSLLRENNCETIINDPPPKLKPLPPEPIYPTKKSEVSEKNQEPRRKLFQKEWN